MGGKAFKSLLPDASFPRVQPSVYNALKSRLQPILETLYAHVAVAPEVPGKADYGDLDFIVAGPREGLTNDEVKDALRATCSVPMEGNRMSNYAIPVDAFEDVLDALQKASGAAKPADPAQGNQGTGKFFQVDVNVCADQVQLERTVFYTSYGDLGFICGLFAHTAGLSFSTFGLKLANPLPTEPPQTYYLSSSMEDILAFFGLSMVRWKQGFATKEDIFNWAVTSPFALPLVAKYRSADYKPSTKERGDARRPMQHYFITFLQTHDLDLASRPPPPPASAIFAVPGSENQDEKLEAALRYFGKHEEHAKLLRVGRAQRRARDILNGTNVQAWTGIKGMPIRFVMDEVKERLPSSVGADTSSAAEADGVPAWQYALVEMSDEEVRKLVVIVKEELDKDGKLEFDWRAAKAAKLERKRLKEQASGGPAAA